MNYHSVAGVVFLYGFFVTIKEDKMKNLQISISSQETQLEEAVNYFPRFS